MARKAIATVNKSLAIRDYKAANATASPKEIAAALVKDGVTVSAQFVSTVLSNARKKGGQVGKRGPKPGKAAAANATFDIANLLAARKFVETVGGVQQAQVALKGFAQLV